MSGQSIISIKRWILWGCLGLGLIWSGEMQAQDARAERMLVRGKPEKALARYRKVIKKTDQNASSCVRLSQLLAGRGQYRDAAFYLGQAIHQGDSTPQRIFTFGKLLLQSGNFADAQKWIVKYEKRTGDTLLTAPLKPQIQAGLDLLAQPQAFSVAPIPGLNSRYSEIGATPILGGVVVTTNRRRGFFIRYTASGTRFYDLYHAPLKPDHTYETPRMMEGRVNFRYHDGPAIFGDGELTLWVTRSNISRGKRRSGNGDNHLRIQYQSKKNQYRWGKRQDLPFASNEYTIAHPAISADGKTLIFASNQPGGFGGFDLYRSRLENDIWGKPENLGKEINSASNELYPAYYGQDMLFFASDRPGGFGGMDIYQASQGSVTNIGSPANTAFDDFGIQFDPKRPEGFLVSNRPGGMGEDDVYRFKKFQSIQGVIVDAQTGNPIPHAKVEIMDLRERLYTYTTNAQGGFSHYLSNGQDAFIRANANNYGENRTAVSLHGMAPGEDKQLTLRLEPELRSAVAVEVTGRGTGQALAGAKVSFWGRKSPATVTDTAGKGRLALEPGREETVVVTQAGFRPAMLRVPAIAAGKNRVVTIPVSLEKGEFVWIKGTVRAQGTGLPIANSTIRVVDLHSQDLAAILLPTDAQGQFMGPIPKDQNLNVLALKDDFLSHRQEMFADSLQSDTVFMHFELEPVKPGQIVRTVYYGYNEADLSRSAQRDLDEIAQFLKANPHLNVELLSHTDCRGNARFNLDLSNRRAEAAVNYLHRRGIPRERMTFQGKGESAPVNGCTDQKPCSDEEHALNRRTEVVVRD